MMKKKKAFTLIELIIVIAIIAILAAIAIPVSSKLIEKAKVAQLEGDIKLIQSAAISTYNETERYVDFDRDIYVFKINGEPFIYDGDNTVFKSLIDGKLNLPFGANYYIQDTQSKDDDGQQRYAQLYITIEKNSISEEAKQKLERDLGITVKDDVYNSGYECYGINIVLGKY